MGVVKDRLLVFIVNVNTDICVNVSVLLIVVHKLYMKSNHGTSLLLVLWESVPGDGRGVERRKELVFSSGRRRCDCNMGLGWSFQ